MLTKKGCAKAGRIQNIAANRKILLVISFEKSVFKEIKINYWQRLCKGNNFRSGFCKNPNIANQNRYKNNYHNVKTIRFSFKTSN
jgi:hypothetical protein